MTFNSGPKCPDIAFFTPQDNIVLEVLYRDINKSRDNTSTLPDEVALTSLSDLNNPKHPNFQPTIFSNRDYNLHDFQSPHNIHDFFFQQYVRWARNIARHQTDVVFVSHIIFYFFTAFPSTVYLFYDFHLIHGIAHWLFIIWCSGPFTLVMHNHIHNNGVLSHSWSLFDKSFPYILEPLMGHTWHSYYYHHIKAHHVEGNGPDDPSSTIRYQRDSIFSFLHYFLRFLIIGWFDLTRYFMQKKKYGLVFKVLSTSIISYTFMYLLARLNFRPTLFVLLLPFMSLRLGLMIGNWGQHAFVDDMEPNSDFRSSITLIDVSSNRFCFNDGYHTSHHLNPRRHWRDHPYAFLKAKEKYENEGALVFQNIDYLEVTWRLLRKDYGHLARQLVLMGSQIGMSEGELGEMLRRKTRAFSEEEIVAKFR